MIRYDRSFRILATGFAALAGFVDAIGFLQTGGLFVSFMSGNSTRLAIGLATGSRAALAAAALIGLFVAGVVLNVLIPALGPPTWRKLLAATGVAVLLLLAAALQTIGWTVAVTGALCMAMGASNTIFQREGEVSVGVTYMTGTLVKFGQRLAYALRGEKDTGWAPYLLLWLALVVGGVAGALGYAWSPTRSLWCAAGFAAALALAVAWLTRGTGP